MLTTSFDMLKKAYEGHYAVPAINTQGGTYDIIRAICMAAEELRSRFPESLPRFIFPRYSA